MLQMVTWLGDITMRILECFGNSIRSLGNKFWGNLWFQQQLSQNRLRTNFVPQIRRECSPFEENHVMRTTTVSHVSLPRVHSNISVKTPTPDFKCSKEKNPPTQFGGQSTKSHNNLQKPKSSQPSKPV